jgi:hypothetical protein
MSALLFATGQRRKLYAGFAISVVSIALAYVAFDIPETLGSAAQMTVFLVGAVGLGASQLYMLRSIACPTCGAKWLQYAFRKKALGSWLHWLTSFETCPGCEVKASGERK